MLRFLPLLAIASLLLLAGGARAPLPSAMEAPAWSAGDYWEYRFNSTFEGSVFLNGTLRADITGLENRTVRGIAQDVIVVGTGGTGSLEGTFETPSGNVSATGVWNLTGEELFAEASRKIVKTLVRISASGHVDILNVPFTLLWTNSTSSRVVADDWRYPVPVGFSGAVTLNSSMAEDVFLEFDSNPPLILNSTLEAEITIAVSLTSMSNATVPAGAFETYLVQEAWPDGGHEMFEYAPAAGNNARTRTFNSTGAEVTRTELVSYRYRAAEPSADPRVVWVAVAGIAVAVAAAIALGVLLARRRRRERAYTPPSLRDPPT